MENTRNFAGAFCAHFGIPQEKFVDALVARSLYPQARFLIPIFSIFRPHLIQCDRELIEEIGHATSLREVEAMLRGLPSYYGRAWRLRRLLRLRVSSRRILEIGRTIFGV